MKKLIVLALVALSFTNSYAQNTTDLTSDKLENAVIYEVNIRQYSPEGSFNAFTKDIPNLKQLGVKVIDRPLSISGDLEPTVSALKHALESTCKYFLFFQEYTTIKLEKHGEYYVVSYKVDDSYLKNQRYDAEITLAIICNLIRKVTYSNWQPALIEFENSEPAFIGDHLAFFKAGISK